MPSSCVSNMSIISLILLHVHITGVAWKLVHTKYQRNGASTATWAQSVCDIPALAIVSARYCRRSVMLCFGRPAGTLRNCRAEHKRRFRRIGKRFYCTPVYAAEVGSRSGGLSNKGVHSSIQTREMPRNAACRDARREGTCCFSWRHYLQRRAVRLTAQEVAASYNVLLAAGAIDIAMARNLWGKTAADRPDSWRTLRPAQPRQAPAEVPTGARPCGAAGAAESPDGRLDLHPAEQPCDKSTA